MAEQNKTQQPEPQRLPNQPLPQGGQGGASTQDQQRSADASRKAGQDAQRLARQRYDEDKKAVANRPQQSGDEGSKPTPTQAENDEIRSGLRHIDDKEDDGSGPDYVHHRVVRRVDADQSKGKYETR